VSDIVEFLRARYTERRAIAEAAAALQYDPENGWGITDSSIYDPAEKRRWISPHIGMLHESESAEHVVANNPAVVLADLDAKLRLVDWSEWPGGGPDSRDAYEWTLAVLAVPFAAHPDYDERWRP
jgi:hypothetical protein